MLQKSLRAQILTLLSASLLAILLIALACFHFLSNGVQNYANLIEGPLHTSQLIDEANLQFKVQVQEWKNVLLRGKQPADLDKYWKQFEDRQRDVQGILGELASQKGLDGQLKTRIERLRDEHRQLGSAYQKGRDAYIAQEVARHAADAARAADDADQSAQQGEKVMSNTIHTITQMRGEIVNTATVTRRLETDSGRISKVLEVIRGIAEQTNLLALNAAIEAARAGDAGRGFAVVADEVRSLAQRTATSIIEINQIIQTVQTGAEDAAKAIESGQTRSEESVAQVNQAGVMLERITHAVEAIRDMNRQIATAAEEQTSVAEDISRNLTEITSIASTNLDNVQRTEAASHNLHGLSGQLNEVTARLSA